MRILVPKALFMRGLEARRALAAAERGLAPAQRDGAFPARGRGELLQGRIDLLRGGRGATAEHECDRQGSAREEPNN